MAENCDGVIIDCPTDTFLPDTTECRPAGGDCDVAENCTGYSADCPVDGFEPEGAPCPDGLFCDGEEECDGLGACQDGSTTCAGNQWCDETTDACVLHGDGDFEPDSDVDLADFAEFQTCFDHQVISGSDCEPANMTGIDGTIDLDDFALFAATLGGPSPR